MEKIKLLVQYDGEWVDEYKFINYKVDGLLLDCDCSYAVFVREVGEHLIVDMSKYNLDIKYLLKDGYQPISIKNDMGVRLYVEMKRTSQDISQYPLCITKDEKIVDINQGKNSAFVDMDDFGGHGNNVEIDIPEVVDMITMGEGEEYKGTPIDEIGVISNPLHDKIAEDQVYNDKETLQSVMKNYALRKRFEYRVERSSSTRYSLECINSECPWMMRASSLNGSSVFVIRKFNDEHSCPIEERLVSQRRATTDMIGRLIKGKFTDPKTVYTPKDIIRDIQKEYGVQLNYMKAWRSKERAINLLRGDPIQSYGKIPSYLYMLNKANPGSFTKLQKSDDGSFEFVFVALASFINGWKYCRPVVVVDGSFLKATCMGTMLTACTLNAAGNILPLAYAIVDSENDDSWEWFFRCFREAYGIRNGMCVVSDRHESIRNASTTVYPEIPHCVCIFHLWNNIKVRFKKSQKQLKRVFFALAMAYTVEEFDKRMKNVEKIDSRVKNYLKDIGYHRWSIVHAVAKRSFFMTSNIAESVNAANRQARELPILALMVYMTDMFQVWIARSRKSAFETFTPLGAKFQDMLNDNIAASRNMTVTPSTEFLFAVQDGDNRHIVCLHGKTCTCQKFQVDELPCTHAVAALDYIKIKPADFCSDYYSKKFLVKTYEVPVYPIQDESFWDVPDDVATEDVLPPVFKRRAGRPKTKRIKSSWEITFKRSRITCAQCGHQGHNRKTCTNPPIRA